MNNNLKEYLEDLQKKHGNEIQISNYNETAEMLKKVPEALRSLYAETSSIIFPFGRIFTIEDALKQSARPPFKSKWFVFGKDNYFSFWLCSFVKDKDGLNFTYWDQDSGNEIEDAVWEDVVSFLQEIEEDSYCE